MENFHFGSLKERFARFERAAAKGHEESMWIGNVVKDVEMEWNAVKEVFAKTEEPLGWWFAGKLSDERESFDFYKKSAEGGCSWGHVEYGECFGRGVFVEKDKEVNLEWMEKAAKQNNPSAMQWLGYWFRREGGEKEKAMAYYRTAAELGWKFSMYLLAVILKNGEGCAKDLRQAVIWSAKGNNAQVIWEALDSSKRAMERGTTGDLDCDFSQLCYSIGWGLYWYQYGNEHFKVKFHENQAFVERCLDFYCSCVELQQKSIFTFLLCWNRTTGGIKGPGQMIAHMVWEGREENLLQTFEESFGEEEPETKRIKK
jgi:hypothetical protein